MILIVIRNIFGIKLRNVQAHSSSQLWSKFTLLRPLLLLLLLRWGGNEILVGRPKIVSNFLFTWIKITATNPSVIVVQQNPSQNFLHYVGDNDIQQFIARKCLKNLSATENMFYYKLELNEKNLKQKIPIKCSNTWKIIDIFIISQAFIKY